MTENILGSLFEHNNWANLKMIEVCSALTEQQLDAAPVSVTLGTIRRTLQHLVSAQEGYVTYLTGVNHRSDWETSPSFETLTESAKRTGDALLEIAKNVPKHRMQTRDGDWVEPRVLIVQVVNHATEHREQLSSMLSAMGIEPPQLDGWAYGEETGGLVPVNQ